MGGRAVIAGLILAAGASSRMGSPKALLEYRGESFLGRLTRVLGEVAKPVVVVLGYHAEMIRPQVGRGAWIVVNPAPERGQLSSLQTGLAAIPAEAEGFLFMPVDCPAVAEDTVRRVAEAFGKRKEGTMLVIPRVHVGGEVKRGHPVCAARPLVAEFLALPGDAQAKDVVHRHVGETQYVDVEDAGILTDVDDPEAYRRLADARTMPGAPETR
jgi:molybdenum cofactor cytidylyltransferase